MMQPAFLPWQGFFELIYKSERFIFLDDFQFSVQSYHQRNRLFVNKNQVDWYTVPTQKSASFKAPLNQTRINETIPWRKKMLKRLQQNYAKAPYFTEIFARIEQWLSTPEDSLAAQNIAFITLVCELLGFEREYRFSSQCPSHQARSKRVVELLNWCDADRYFCAKGSFAYMQEDAIFPVDGIDVLFQNFTPKAYKQIGSEESFVPSLSVLDVLFNIGPAQTAELIRNGTDSWLAWEDMSLAAAAMMGEECVE